MKKFLKSTIIITICILFSTLTACADTSKKVTISDNTKEEILVEENQATALINNSKKYINDKKYYEALSNYNKAIELDKGNKDLYLEIKDAYLEGGQFDDVYFITKTAITEVVYDKQIGSIKDIYTKDGKTYIDVDLVEFYFGKELALKEAFKDNANEKISYKEDGTPYVPDGYYIRNNSNKITTYEISINSSFQLLHHDLVETLGIPTNYPGNSSISIITSFDDFKNYINLKKSISEDTIDINSNKPITNRETLFWIESKNNSAYSIYRQYTP